MTRHNAIVDRYVAMWNEPDPDLRRTRIEQLFTPDAEYLMFSREPLVGYDAIAGQIDFAHELYFEQGFMFKSSNNAEGHHNLVKFNWVLVSAETGDLESHGFDLFLLADDERISKDYQFLSKPAFASWDRYIAAHSFLDESVRPATPGRAGVNRATL